MNACQAVQELLAAHVLTALKGSEEALVHAHLETCEDCQQVEAETRACVELIAAPPVKPPPEVWHKIRARIDRSEQGGTDAVRNTDPNLLIALSCSFCRGGMVRPRAVYCASCLAPHHPECFAEHGRCSVMGCGETQIVRPSELPPIALPAPEPDGKVVAFPSRRRRWILGGLASAVVGGLAAAALNQAEQKAFTPSRIPRPTIDVPGKRFDITIKEATLGEVVRKINGVMKQKGLKARVVIDPEARQPLANLIIRRRDWVGVEWSEALGQLTSELGLELAQVSSGDWRIKAGPGFRGEPPRSTAQIRVDQMWLVPAGDGEEHMLREGWELQVHPAPAGKGVALVEGLMVRVFDERRARLEQVGEKAFASPPQVVSWSSDGLWLACGFNKRNQGRLAVFNLKRPARGWNVLTLPSPLDDESRLAWLDTNQVVLKTGNKFLLVSTVLRENVTHLSVPVGQGRFAMHALRGGRLLLLRDRLVEGLKDLPFKVKTYFRRELELPGYRIDLALGAERALIVGHERCHMLSLAKGTLERNLSLPVRTQPEKGGAWLARLSSSGSFVAWRDGNDSFLGRPGAPSGKDRCVLDDPEELVEGFAWEGGSQERLAYWTRSACFVVDGVGSLSFDGALPDENRTEVFTTRGEILGGRWVGGAVLLSVRKTRYREGTVQLDSLEPGSPRRQ